MKSSSRKFFCHTDFANFTVRQHINFHYNFLHTKNVIVLTKILSLTQKDAFRKPHPHRIQLQFHVHHHSSLRNFHTKIEEKSYFFTSIFNTQKHSHTLLCSKWVMEKNPCLYALHFCKYIQRLTKNAQIYLFLNLLWTYTKILKNLLLLWCVESSLST